VQNSGCAGLTKGKVSEHSKGSLLANVIGSNSSLVSGSNSTYRMSVKSRIRANGSDRSLLVGAVGPMSFQIAEPEVRIN
jgi:hypothetical protein